MDIKKFLGFQNISTRTAAICIGIGLFVPSLPILTAIAAGNFVDSKSREAIAIAVDNAGYSDLAFIVFYIGVLIPIFEELVFRSALWGVLENLYSKATALVVTTAMFIAIHGTIDHMIGIAGISVCMGIIRYQTESVSSTILIHMANNLLVILAMIFVVRGLG